ncbi:MAG: hypothetical protein LBR48_03160 [Dysgonamonadaceae bacterium]|jgi:hypothetical protein|nr:hypothetical protein [Dysgonamonadaceae bacterium]
MSAQEFIKNQVENFTLPLSKEQFVQLSEMENSLIIIEVPFKDYMLTEIARIVENNNAHVLSLTVLPVGDDSTLLVSVKLDIPDITAALRSFERFGYKVVYSFTKKGEIDDIRRERIDELLYYLNM